MINNKDLAKDTLAWHEGMDKWLPIGEIDLFESSFQELPRAKNIEHDSNPSEKSSVEVVDKSNVKAYLEQLAKQDKVSSHKPVRKYTADGDPVTTLHDGEIGIFLWRRIFARILDSTFLISVLFMTAIFAHKDPVDFFTKAEHGVLIFTFYTFYEILCLHLFGSSIGKAILGIRIESFAGPNLSLLRATFRGLATTFIILVFGDPIFAIVLFFLCILFVKKRKMLPWDVYGASSARALPFSKNHLIGGILFYIIINLIVGLMTPEHITEGLLENLKESLSPPK